MAILSAMSHALGRHGLRRCRRHFQRHREDGALPRSCALRDDVAAHATRELARDGETQARAMRHTLATAAIVQIEQLLGRGGIEAATLVADVEMPEPVTNPRRDAHASTAILVGVVEKVF